MRETLEITDRSYVIRAGQVLCHGQPRDILQNPEARKYYFGEGMDALAEGPHTARRPAPSHAGGFSGTPRD